MIWYWLHLLGDFAWRLFAPLKERDLARVDPYERCPVCAYRPSWITKIFFWVRRMKLIRAVVLKVVAQGKPVTPGVFCQHTCYQCGARWFEQTVVKVGIYDVMSAVPRTEIEKEEDEQYGTPKSVTVTGAPN